MPMASALLPDKIRTAREHATPASSIEPVGVRVFEGLRERGEGGGHSKRQTTGASDLYWTASSSDDRYAQPSSTDSKHSCWTAVDTLYGPVDYPGNTEKYNSCTSSLAVTTTIPTTTITTTLPIATDPAASSASKSAADASLLQKCLGSMSVSGPALTLSAGAVGSLAFSSTVYCEKFVYSYNSWLSWQQEATNFASTIEVTNSPTPYLTVGSINPSVYCQEGVTEYCSSGYEPTTAPRLSSTTSSSAVTGTFAIVSGTIGNSATSGLQASANSTYDTGSKKYRAVKYRAPDAVYMRKLVKEMHGVSVNVPRAVTKTHISTLTKKVRTKRAGIETSEKVTTPAKESVDRTAQAQAESNIADLNTVSTTAHAERSSRRSTHNKGHCDVYQTEHCTRTEISILTSLSTHKNAAHITTMTMSLATDHSTGSALSYQATNVPYPYANDTMNMTKLVWEIDAIAQGCLLNLTANQTACASVIEALAQNTSLWTSSTFIDGVTNSTILNGTIINGTVVNGVMLNGTLLNGTITNGTVSKGALLNSTIFDMDMIDGAFINGTFVNGTFISTSISNSTNTSSSANGVGAIDYEAFVPVLATRVSGAPNNFAYLAAPYPYLNATANWTEVLGSMRAVASGCLHRSSTGTPANYSACMSAIVTIAEAALHPSNSSRISGGATMTGTGVVRSSHRTRHMTSSAFPFYGSGHVTSGRLPNAYETSTYKGPCPIPHSIVVKPGLPDCTRV